MFDLTEYKYLRPLDKTIGYHGISHIFLYNCDDEYVMNPDRLYQIINQYEHDSYYKDHYYLYNIMDLKTLRIYTLVTHKKNDLKVMEKLFELIKT